MAFLFKGAVRFGVDTEMGVCQDTLIFVVSGWVLPQGRALEGL